MGLHCGRQYIVGIGCYHDNKYSNFCFVEEVKTILFKNMRLYDQSQMMRMNHTKEVIWWSYIKVYLDIFFSSPLLAFLFSFLPSFFLFLFLFLSFFLFLLMYIICWCIEQIFWYLDNILTLVRVLIPVNIFYYNSLFSRLFS